MHILFRVVAVLALCGCAAGETGPRRTLVPASLREAGAVPVKGWLPGYDDLIVAEAAKYPELVRLSAARVGALCPKWDSLEDHRKRRFFADFLRVVALFESGHDPAAMALEKAMSTDPVTRRQVVSEGLLQLSYQDQRNFPGCAFDFAADRTRFDEDWSLQDARKTDESALLKSWTAKNTDRSILTPAAQFACAVSVVSAAARASQREGKSLLASLGYWQNLDGHTNPAAYREIVATLGAETPYCR